MTADSSRLRAPGRRCSGRPSGGAPRLRRNSKEVSFNTLCDPDLSLLGWGLGPGVAGLEAAQGQV